MKLRPYQEELINKTRSLMKDGVKSIIIQSPTGSGKTLLTAHMLKSAASKGLSSWFIVHRRELIKQSVAAFSVEDIPHGVIAAGFYPKRNELVQIASIQTLAKRFHNLRKPKLIVWDECQHNAAKSWDKIFKMFPDAYHIGLTATPERLDGKGLGQYFSKMVHGPSVQWLIENKFLSPYRLFAPTSLNLSGLHIRMGDYIQSETQAAVDKPTITGCAIEHYKKHAFGKRALIFAVSVAHSKHVVAQFNAAGIEAEHVDGETSYEQRDNSIRDFKNGTLKILSNVNLFGEGFDVPAIEALIILRPTMSLALFLQMIGRSLRPMEGKEHAIIFDHASNTEKFGLPDDIRTWSLEGAIKSRKSTEDGPTLSVRVCPSCFAACRSPIAVCPFCGFTFPVESRQVEEKKGELTEVDLGLARKAKKREQGRAETYEELLDVAYKRGYKYPKQWVGYIIKARDAKRNLQSLDSPR